MKNLERILNMLIKKISARSVLDGQIDCQQFLKNDFIKVAFSYLKEYSESELENMWMYYKDIFQGERRDYGRTFTTGAIGISVFDVLFYYVSRILTIQNNEVLCRYNELMRWRMLTFEVSEDLLVSAYWAQQKQPDEMDEIGFTWKMVIGHNNYQLNRILQRGYSENHFHLYGSAPMFHISWISLMNNILNSKPIESLMRYDRDRRYCNIRYSADYQEESLVVQYYQAALIRVFLFSVIKDISIRVGSYFIGSDQYPDIFESLFPYDRWERQENRVVIDFAQYRYAPGLSEEYECIFRNITFQNVERLLKDSFDMQENISSIQSVIDSLRNSPESSGEFVDYALAGVMSGMVDDNDDIFAGEHWFLYSCLNHIYRGNFSPKYENLFYAYVLIKETIRSEMLQSNHNVGFVNFHKYQSRKWDLLDGRIFEEDMVRCAVNGNLLNRSLRSLEIRIAPYETVQKNREMIQKLDRIIGEPRDKYFYTLHFIKSQDNRDYQNEYVQCRHYTLRKKIERQAKAIVKLREEFPGCAKRILGIDAAANEIGCRPEVFACSFRYLRRHMKIIDDGFERDELPQLRVTYHAGEDFLDLADGLRAIDEAVNFLNMDCGDRLGHALALGVDVEDWYQSKNNMILISQQDFLDNLVWIYNRIIQFNITHVDNLKDYIEKKYNYFFYKIYGNHMNYAVIDNILHHAGEKYGRMGIITSFHNDRFRFDISQYYNAWKLRGDDPEIYSHGYFFWKETGDLWTSSAVNKVFPKNMEIRYVPEVFILNYYYHFNNDVRREGNKRIQVKVRPFYVQGVKKIQMEMQKRIGRRGIGIETNPSSNYLIGTFKSYEKHPIITFYNKDITFDQEKLNSCPQLSVSVNTDDMGVFSTSVENEYALLANALENAVDKEGNLLYNKSMVYKWIDSVREMGNEQSFIGQGNQQNSQDDEAVNPDQEFFVV